MKRKEKLFNNEDYDVYENLANAIIIQACKDYLYDNISEYTFKKFCLSEWFQLLTILDGKFIFEEMRKIKNANT